MRNALTLASFSLGRSQDGGRVFRPGTFLACQFLSTFLVVAGIAAESARTAPPDQASPTQPTQTPVFKSRTDVVRVSVAVIDKTGKPLTGLTARDFTVLENGVPQTVSTFASEQASAPSTGGPSAQDRRVFLIMFGHGPTDGPVHLFEGAIRFVRERLLPQDLVAVMAFDRATPFTTGHEQIAQVVERLKRLNNAITGETEVDSRRKFGWKEDLAASLQREIDAALQLAEGPEFPLRNVTTMLLGASVLRENDNTWRPWNRMVANQDLLRVYAGIEYLRHVEGEKHLIWLMQKFGGPPPLRFVGNVPIFLWLEPGEGARLATRANDAHVALDIIRSYPVALRDDFIMSAESISDLSGGQFTGVRTADAALANIDAVTRAGYVLGYMPANPNLDGKYRNVVVKVNRPGVTVLFPHGYTAQPDPPPLGLREIVTRERLRDAAATDVAQDDIKVQAKASAVSAPGAAGQVRVELTIDASRLTFTRVGDKWEGTIDLMIVCGDAKQKVVGAISQQMAMSLDEDHYRQAMRGGIPRVEVVPVTSAATFVKVLVYDYETDRLGAAVVKLK